MVANNRNNLNCRGLSSVQNGSVSRGENRGQGNVENLKKQLQIIDFAIYETVLYLNAYPSSETALNYYHKLLKERNQLTEALASYGHPITHLDNASTESWQWTEGPWPWMLDAN